MNNFCVNQVLLEALSRCVSVLTASSKPDDMAVQVSFITKDCVALYFH